MGGATMQGAPIAPEALQAHNAWGRAYDRPFDDDALDAGDRGACNLQILELNLHMHERLTKAPP